MRSASSEEEVEGNEMSNRLRELVSSPEDVRFVVVVERDFFEDPVPLWKLVILSSSSLVRLSSSGRRMLETPELEPVPLLLLLLLPLLLLEVALW